MDGLLKIFKWVMAEIDANASAWNMPATNGFGGDLW